MCVPGFHKEWEVWEEMGELPFDVLKGQPFSDQPFASMKSTEVEGKAGDLLIWNRLLCAQTQEARLFRRTC